MGTHCPNELGRYIVYRDIKPENILIRATLPQDGMEVALFYACPDANRWAKKMEHCR